ncbi:MAG: hypothetical protein QM764_22375 [Chitinophagaceae bacterium]
MRKTVVILFMICSMATAAQSDVSTKVKQIALLQAYIGWLEKGYDIARKGLTTIGAIKDKHWKLDIDFFNSLSTINPKIAKYGKVAAILSVVEGIAKECASLKKVSVNPDEVSYISSVTAHLLVECELLAAQLGKIITDHVYQLTDDERIKRIDAIYNDAVDQYDFIRHFSEQAKLLIRERKKESNDISVSEKLHSL